ncbi:MAG: NACHT domain-containing protein [Hamadaea sp.]|uniref:NACHT domain-containing protein n=1 Tax=Hamadaea sp. TaxID=2024425 RepID=UPI0017EE6BEE|nr:NACHT domain-containing protein [Hamadaea sp.]NUT18496.1 NACHT domain-containing protein [Hamadaea sp.]
MSTSANPATDHTTALPLPHPSTDPDTEAQQLQELYRRMCKAYAGFASGLAAWTEIKVDANEVLSEIPALAYETFQAQYLALLAESPEFHRWAEIYEHTRGRQQSARLAAELRIELQKVSDTAEAIDVGMQRLMDAISTRSKLADTATDGRTRKVVSALHKEYADRIQTPVIVDKFRRAGTTTLTYPTKAELFVPQSFQTLRCLAGASEKGLRLELDDSWKEVRSQNGLGVFLVRFLSSPYATESPLLILGQPGSGKSLLTEILAARMAPPQFVPIRIELRDVNAEAELQDLIEQRIREDTGHDVNWAELAEDLADTPPVVILDGYDELLQASGKVYSTFLSSKIRQFQRREAIQGRPVRIIVTSRMTLIDKATLPDDITVVRLLDFDQERRDKFAEVWNSANAEYFRDHDVRPFALPAVSRVAQLAAQPLLLLMLAVYDSHANQLDDADLDRATLYHNLLSRFVERERTKGDGEDDFAALTPRQQTELIERDLERLGVAALGMFNRKAVHIGQDDLNKDIAFFRLEQPVPGGPGHPLSQAELLLGSFFFIHESKSRGAAVDAPTTFEFLHNTFGEFLTADFLVRRLLRQTDVVRTLRRQPTLADMYHDNLVHLPPEWYAQLIYTSLHTRPVVLDMMREWLPSRLAAAGLDRDVFEEDLERIANRQLAAVLDENDPPQIMLCSADTPFEALPLTGHLAVYSLNLVLLWTLLSTEPVTVSAHALQASAGECRPWDRLVQLWRSWFSLATLTGLAGTIRAGSIGDNVRVARSDIRAAPSGVPIEDAFVVANALADDLTFSLAGLHVFDQAPSVELLRTIQQHQLTAPITTDSRRLRVSPNVTGDIARRYGDDLRSLPNPDRGIHPGLLTIMEVCSPGALDQETCDALSSSVAEPRIIDFAPLSRYEAQVLIRHKEALFTEWFDDLIKDAVAKAYDILEIPAGSAILDLASRRPSLPHAGDLALHCVGRHPADAWTELALIAFGLTFEAPEVWRPAVRRVADTPITSLANAPVHLIDQVLSHFTDHRELDCPERDVFVDAVYEWISEPRRWQVDWPIFGLTSLLRHRMGREMIWPDGSFSHQMRADRRTASLALRLAYETGSPNELHGPLGIRESTIEPQSILRMLMPGLSLDEICALRWLGRTTNDEVMLEQLDRLVDDVLGR